MSYILDALKKSEQQRGHGNIPDVQTVHSSSLNYREEKKAYWPYILIAAILLNLIAIVYFIFDKQAEPKPESRTENIAVIQTDSVTKEVSAPLYIPIEKAETKKTPVAVVELTPPAPIITSNNEFSSPNNNAPVLYKKSTEPSGKEKITSETVDYYDLPEPLQLEIPTITVSAHIYSSNPQQRSIVINNVFLEEGDYVLDDLILIEITLDGAIFDYQSTKFHYPVVSGWQ